MDYYGPMLCCTRFTRLIALAPFVLACASPMALAALPEEPAPATSPLTAELFYEIVVGELSAQSGDTETSFRFLLDAARKANSAALYERATGMALQARSGEAALTAVQAWINAFPKSQDALRLQLQILIGLNRIAETLEPLRRSLALLAPAERVATINLLPRFFARTTDKKLVQGILEAALLPELNQRASGPAAWASIGIVRMQAGSTAGALEAAKRGAALNPSATEPILLAMALMEANVAPAEALVLHYLKENRPADMRMMFARTLLSKQRYADALVQAERIAADTPDYADAWLLRGTLELQDRKSALAERSLLRYVSLTTPRADEVNSQTPRGLVQAYFSLAQIAEQNKKPEEALTYLARINSTADTLRVQTRRATILARKGQLEEARALIRNTPEQQPDDARAKINAEVQLLRDFKQYKAAYTLLRDAQTRFPEDTELLYDQAMMAEKLDRLEEMEQLLRKVIQAKPDHQHAYNALGYSLADRGLRLTEARELIAKALQLSPNDPYIVDSMAWVEYRANNLPEALRLLTSAYKARPDAEIAAHLGEVLWKMGEREQALARWKEGQALNPDNDTLRETMQRLQAAP